MRIRIALAVFLIGAAPSLWWMWRGLKDTLDFTGFYHPYTSSGVGAVAGSFREPMFALVSLVIVLLLAARARGRGTLARRLGRLHRYTSLGVVAVALLLLPAEFVRGWGDLFQRLSDDIFTLSIVGFALFLPWQALCASAFVALMVAEPKSPR